MEPYPYPYVSDRRSCLRIGLSIRLRLQHPQRGVIEASRLKTFVRAFPLQFQFLAVDELPAADDNDGTLIAAACSSGDLADAIFDFAYSRK